MFCTWHLYLEELAANNGHLIFPYFGKVKVPDAYLTVIQTYPEYFKAGSRAKLEGETRLLSTMGTYSGSTIKPFKNSILMAKLNLIGEEGMNEILRLAKMEHLGTGPYPPICFIKSLDAGYDWNDISFDDYCRKTEILEERIVTDTVIEGLHPGMPRDVYKNLNLNGNKLTVNCI